MIISVPLIHIIKHCRFAGAVGGRAEPPHESERRAPLASCIGCAARAPATAGVAANRPGAAVSGGPPPTAGPHLHRVLAGRPSRATTRRSRPGGEPRVSPPVGVFAAKALSERLGLLTR